MSSHLNRYLFDEKGATQIEYALIALFVSIAAVTVFYSIRNKMQNWYWDAVNNLAS
ncbi:MAG: Flp family type IVb pilin [Methylocystis sp.]